MQQAVRGHIAPVAGSSSPKTVNALWPQVIAASVSANDYGDRDDPDCPVTVQWGQSVDRMAGLVPHDAAGEAKHLAVALLSLTGWADWSLRLVMGGATDDDRRTMQAQDMAVTLLWGSIQRLARVAAGSGDLAAGHLAGPWFGLPVSYRPMGALQ